ncbi:hypothetical protein RDWZM_001256 [Blomia tropicalis]|uniref:Uncharacterized protein n=1 Tax=Blomia tropicalis TaxID=40697 RepID=A0A9Q0RQG0_BLOTA|nr:hypothetical protein RDWZM_001256 [Blomia tropicalis]
MMDSTLTSAFSQSSNLFKSKMFSPNQIKLQRQILVFLFEDCDDFLYDFKVEDIAKGRRQTMVNKADCLINKLDEIGQKILINEADRVKIRKLRRKLEIRANNLCQLMDGQRHLLQLELEESDDDDEDSYYETENDSEEDSDVNDIDSEFIDMFKTKL